MGKKEDAGELKEALAVLMETLLFPISPAKKQAITPPVCLAATGIYTWFVFIPLHISRLRLETHLLKSTGEINVKQKSPLELLVGRRRGNQERSPGTLVRSTRTSFGKPSLGPWAVAKPASSPVSWHYAIITGGQQCRQQRDM